VKVAKIAYALLVLAMPSVVSQAQTTQHETRFLAMRWAQYYSASYQVPVELVFAIIDEESAWDPYAVSEKGAVGLMQLMPGTAARFGVRNLPRAEYLQQQCFKTLVHLVEFINEKYARAIFVAQGTN
jgi:soluble lytic murein transglycosylase-like protein